MLPLPDNAISLFSKPTFLLAALLIFLIIAPLPAQGSSDLGRDRPSLAVDAQDAVHMCKTARLESALLFPMGSLSQPYSQTTKHRTDRLLQRALSLLCHEHPGSTACADVKGGDVDDLSVSFKFVLHALQLSMISATGRYNMSSIPPVCMLALAAAVDGNLVPDDQCQVACSLQGMMLRFGPAWMQWHSRVFLDGVCDCPATSFTTSALKLLHSRSPSVPRSHATLYSRLGLLGIPSEGMQVKKDMFGSANNSSNAGFPTVVVTYEDGMSWQHLESPLLSSCVSSNQSACIWYRSLPRLMADVVIFDCLQKPPPKLRPLQRHIFLCLESGIHLPHTTTAKFANQFDEYAAHRRNPPAGFKGKYHWLTYSLAPSMWKHVMQSPDVPQILSKLQRAVWVVSNCAPARIQMVQSLSEHIPIDIFGKCSGIPLPDVDGPLLFNSSKASLVSKYSFVISFENALEDDYVTEKLWQTLMVGSIPIYFGAPNVRQYLPSEESVVCVLDFKTVNELGKHLRALLSQPALLEQAVSWREQRFETLPKGFRELSKHAFNAGRTYHEKDMRQRPCFFKNCSEHLD